MNPSLSTHIRQREPSAIRRAQILFGQRQDRDAVSVINLAIGNVSLPMHPAMRERMLALGAPGSPFADGAVRYTETSGTEETRRAFLRVIESAGADTSRLAAMITDGGSAAMELMLIATCGPASSRPVLLLDPAYANYADLARRVAVPTVSARRELGSDGAFAEPDLDHLIGLIRASKPAAMVVIPADNPTGQRLTMDQLARMARICVDHDMWLVSDEAYRQIQYREDKPTSVWLLDEHTVPGLGQRRMSIETASKVFNACGLRIGALVSDHHELIARCIAEYTANLCANAIGQYIFGALAQVPVAELQRWYGEQRAYYGAMAQELEDGLHAALPGLIVARPEAALYTVIDVRNIVRPGFESGRFVAWCASVGSTELNGTRQTLLVAPMSGFYHRNADEQDDPGATQMRLAFVAPPAPMRKVPQLFARLLRAYEATR